MDDKQEVCQFCGDKWYWPPICCEKAISFAIEKMIDQQHDNSACTSAEQKDCES